jgi:hypothetical protein
MAFSSEIMAKLGLDTKQFTNGLATAQKQVGTFATDAKETIAKRFSGNDLFRGLMQGLGIGTVQQIAERVVEPFRKAAEYAKQIAEFTAQAANANIARMRGGTSLDNQLSLAEQDRARLARQVADLNARTMLTDEERVALLEKSNALREAEAAIQKLGADISARENASTAVQAKEFEKQRSESEKWFADRNAQAEKEKSAASAAAAEKRAEEEQVNRTLAEQKAAREALAAGLRTEAELARQKGEIEAANAKRLADFQREQDAINLRKQLGSEGLAQTEFLVDGRRFSGQARSRAEFEAASPEALQEFIRRTTATIGQIQSGFGRGEQGLTDVVTGGLVRNLAASVLQTEVGFARDRLRDIGRFSGVSRTDALRSFEGDPLAFDRLFESSQRNFEATNRTAAAMERLTRLFETGSAKAATVVTAAAPGVFPRS